MKKSKFLFLGLLFAVALAQASVVSGKITALQVNRTSGDEESGGWIYFKVVPAAGSGLPHACATNSSTNYMVYSGSNGEYVENPHVLAFLLTAYATGSPVYISGLNACLNGREMLNSIILQ